MRKTCADKSRFLERSRLSGSLRALFCSVITACALVTTSRDVQAEATRIECGAQKEARLELDENWEELAIQHPSVLCSFRRKSGGFPTATVVWEGQTSASMMGSEASRADAIVQSYHRVGLTDAKILESRSVSSDNRAAFTAVVSYTTLKTPMMAIIVIIEGASRTFTLTLLDTAEDFPASKPRLEEISRTFQTSEPRAPGGRDKAPLSPGTWIGLLAIGIMALVLSAFLTIRLLRRK